MSVAFWIVLSAAFAAVDRGEVQVVPIGFTPIIVRVDGVPATSNGDGEGFVYSPLTPGSHLVEVQPLFSRLPPSTATVEIEQGKRARFTWSRTDGLQATATVPVIERPDPPAVDPLAALKLQVALEAMRSSQVTSPSSPSSPRPASSSASRGSSLAVVEVTGFDAWGWNVSIDGRRVGWSESTESWRVAGLAPGRHDLTLESGGQRFNYDVTVSAGSRAHCYYDGWYGSRLSVECSFE